MISLWCNKPQDQGKSINDGDAHGATAPKKAAKSKAKTEAKSDGKATAKRQKTKDEWATTVC
jgi:hypothetical protein